MKKKVLYILFIMISVTSFASNNKTQEIYDSVSTLFLAQEIKVSEVFPPYKTYTIKIVDRNNFYNTPDTARFWTYDIIENQWIPKDTEFNQNFGIYAIYERSNSSSLPYYVLFENNRYNIYPFIEDKFIDHVKDLLGSYMKENDTQRIVEYLNKQKREQNLRR